MKTALAIVALLLATVSDLRAQPRQEFHVERAAQPPTIDGVLDDRRREPVRPEPDVGNR